MTTPVNSLTELTAAQPQPHVPINEALRLFDAVVGMSVLDRVAAPLGGEVTGDRYIVTTGTGAFAGHDDAVAVKTDTGWEFHVPKDGWFARVRDEAVFYYFNEDLSPPAWEELQTGGGPGGMSDPVLLTESSIPTAPAAGSAQLFNFDLGTFGLPHWLLDDGSTIPLLYNVGATMRQIRENGSNTTAYVIGASNAAVGTSSAQQPTFANMLTSLYRTRHQSSAAINSSGSNRASTEACGVPRGSVTGKYGGFLAHFRFGSQACSESGTRFFAGMRSGFAIIGTTADPSSLVDCVGIGKDAADTNLQFMHNDGTGTATKVDLGFTLASLSAKLLDLYLLAEREGNVRYALLSDGVVVASGEVSTDLPTNTVRVYPIIHINTGAGTTAQNIELNSMTWYDFTGIV